MSTASQIKADTHSCVWIHLYIKIPPSYDEGISFFSILPHHLPAVPLRTPQPPAMTKPQIKYRTPAVTTGCPEFPRTPSGSAVPECRWCHFGRRLRSSPCRPFQWTETSAMIKNMIHPTQKEKVKCFLYISQIRLKMFIQPSRTF